MPDDDDTAEIGTPLNLDVNPPDSVNEGEDDQDADPPDPRRFDGSSNEPDTGFSSGH
jgi:hypothetical protein